MENYQEYQDRFNLRDGYLNHVLEGKLSKYIYAEGQNLVDGLSFDKFYKSDGTLHLPADSCIFPFETLINGLTRTCKGILMNSVNNEAMSPNC